MKHVITVVTLFVLIAGGSFAQSSSEKEDQFDFAAVQAVEATQTGSGWRFNVTVRHNDQGWEHYADAWQVLDPESGDIIAERILLHPHDSEQPFTRSLSGVEIDITQRTLLFRAKCNVHGFGGKEILVNLINTEENPAEVSVTRK